ncbi:hypothetical protein FJZ36_09115 [Candidatus Poribacteria bacterium]|nr:hypothetical protein [Candidatus Poribacteria bacterium]
MQVFFIVLFGASLVCFSLAARVAARMLPYWVAGTPVEGSLWAELGLWTLAFVAAFIGTGFFLYERERDEGRIGRRIAFYELLLRVLRRTPPDSPPKPIRRRNP